MLATCPFLFCGTLAYLNGYCLVARVDPAMFSSIIELPVGLPVDLVVNAGGKSRRMGVTKALLPVPPHATPLLVYIIRRLTPLVMEDMGKVVVVTADALTLDAAAQMGEDVAIVGDHWPQGGALGGIASGLALCRGWAMVVACDMPLVSASLFAKLLAVASAQPGVDAVIPVVADQAQPFHGLWHRRLLPHLEARLCTRELGVIAALQGQSVAWVDVQPLGMGVDDSAFWNVNTPQEWDDVLAVLQDQNRPIA